MSRRPALAPAVPLSLPAVVSVLTSLAPAPAGACHENQSQLQIELSTRYWAQFYHDRVGAKCREGGDKCPEPSGVVDTQAPASARYKRLIFRLGLHSAHRLATRSNEVIMKFFVSSRKFSM